jgi:hypothetical protein
MNSKELVIKLERVQEFLHEPENIALAQTCLDIHTGYG